MKDSVRIPRWCWVTFGIIILVFLGYLALVVFIIEFKNFPKISDQGQFGDSFGVVNALFTAFAFWGVIVTLALQRQEIALQQDELRGQRQSLEKETFERTFFYLTGLFDSKYYSIEVFTGSQARGAEVFDNVIQWVLHDKKKYGQYTVYLSTVIKSYFLFLIKILKVIEDAKFDENSKKFYADVLRDQMPENAVETLLLLCMDEEWCEQPPIIESEQLSEMIEKYSLFFNMRFEVLKDLYDRDIKFNEFYHIDAFGDRPDVLGFYTGIMPLGKPVSG